MSATDNDNEVLRLPLLDSVYYVSALGEILFPASQLARAKVSRRIKKNCRNHAGPYLNTGRLPRFAP